MLKTEPNESNKENKENNNKCELCKTIFYSVVGAGKSGVQGLCNNCFPIFHQINQWWEYKEGVITIFGELPDEEVFERLLHLYKSDLEIVNRAFRIYKPNSRTELTKIFLMKSNSFVIYIREFISYESGYEYERFSAIGSENFVKDEDEPIHFPSSFNNIPSFPFVFQSNRNKNNG